MRKHNPSWSISSRPPPPRADQTPGPGSYNPVDNLKSPKMSIGRAVRKGLIHNVPQYPGPGAYSYVKPYSKGSFMGSSARPGFWINTSPGPGSYSPRSQKQGPSYTLRTKLRYRKGSVFPSPGQYDPKAETQWQRVPRTTVGKERRMDLKQKEIPGPGTYKERRWSNGPRWGFGRTKREYSVKNEAPGPGSYELERY